MNRNMAIINLHIFGVGIILLCCVHHSLQDCLRPTNVDPNLVITPNQTTYTLYYKIILTCQDGYDHSGPSDSFCYQGQGGSDDYWYPDPSLAKCEGDCLSPPNTNDTTGSYPHAEKVTFFCREGFELEGGGNSNELTCDDGSWDLEFNCESAGCPLPSVPIDVEIEDPEGDSYKVHSRVALKCIGNRTLSGPGFSYCNETSQWDPDPMTIKCRDQCLTPSFDDSRIIHTSHLTGNSGQSFYDHTDTIKFSCEDGIFVDGPWKSACKDGVWSPRIGGYRPVCKKNCTVPENMSNEGALFQHSKSHTFTCNNTPGMVRMGGPLSFCSDGVWMPRIRCALKRDLRSEL
ncbi:sushi, von Willebrand factor type A, EGF and pentraxin domain-containing protein 1-like [Lytechinus variegatus]|uniref:sushi, von Willebrand factor type A, EGF and pentraxin domain-containing protein 1-like n=1 Tax=Lytechinus variegatus TaxID=7654 RepID=UPI001BB13387|nr:sushi, von Willebrand factor type A, EGF and pentraxin domain-containing protein 1-like [Lytechinus variegatus]